MPPHGRWCANTRPLQPGNDDNPDNTLGFTLRHSLHANANGSIKLEWLKKLDSSGFVGNNSKLHLHTPLFSGDGDSLMDHNRRRTVLSVGLSLVDG